MGTELFTRKHEGDQPHPSRRQWTAGMLAMLGGGLGVAATAAAAFPPGSQGHFGAASHILDRYGVEVTGDDTGEHDVLGFEVAPLPTTEYTQTVGPRGPLGEIIPCIKTSVLGDDASFTHFHPGEVVPCVKTAIQGHTLGTHELFDADQGGVDPCWRVESEMLDGGHIGNITATHFHFNPDTGEIVPCVKTTIEGHSLVTTELFDAEEGGIIPCVKLATEMLEGGRLGAIEVTVNDPDENLLVHVGDRTYRLLNGELVEQRGEGEGIAGEEPV